MITICREYILGLTMETKRKEISIETPEGIQRAAELAAYFTHCSLQSGHLQLSLRSAMTYKMKNFTTASAFARRLLELGPAPQIGQAVRNLPFFFCFHYWEGGREKGKGRKVIFFSSFSVKMESCLLDN